MILLDLFCGGGGAGMGYARAGFTVVGVDHRPQPRYPLSFVDADALEYVAAYGGGFDAIHASPPCQAYAHSGRIRGREHPDLVAATRDALEQTGRPYVIENVPGSPLRNFTVLEGQMFEGLRTQRARWFETNWPLSVPFLRSPRPARNAQMGRPAKPHEWLHVVGNAPDPAASAAALGIDWRLTREELAQAIPPAYTELIGRQLAAHLTRLRHETAGNSVTM